MGCDWDEMSLWHLMKYLILQDKNCRFFIQYDEELLPSSRERQVFNVIYDRIERKEEAEVAFETKLKDVEANLMKKK